MNTFPKTIALRHGTAKLRMMSRADADAILAFARSLPAHDLLFLRRNITNAVGVAGWVEKIEAGLTATLIAEIDGEIAGYGTFTVSDYDWSRHVAELRVMVKPERRESGIGRILVREVFRLALARGIEKMVARMTLDQTGARKLFQELGFHPEALLAHEVKDRNGQPHDLLVMAVDVDAFLARREVYGLHN